MVPVASSNFALPVLVLALALQIPPGRMTTTIKTDAYEENSYYTPGWNHPNTSSEDGTRGGWLENAVLRELEVTLHGS